MAAPSERIRELETLLEKIRRSGACLVNYEMWTDRAKSFASAEEIAAMEAEAEAARHENEEATALLEALVVKTRAEAPSEIEAWVAAHDVYLRVFAAEEKTTLPFAQEAREAWAAVARGERAFVESTGGISEEDAACANRFRLLFGIDPKTLETSAEPIPDWYLHFRPLPDRVVAVEACARALEAVARVPSTIALGEINGNPRDYYGRSVTITAGPLLSMWLTQSMFLPDDPIPETSLGAVAVKDSAATTFASKMLTWRALREAFEGIGCTDVTLASSPAPIVDEALAAGEIETATRLRREITSALIDDAANRGMISLRATRPDDIDAVLAAYPAPLPNGWVSLCDCGFKTLPAGLARFAADIDTLVIDDRLFFGRGLDGMALPGLVRLYLSGSGIRMLQRVDLAGFPNLVELGLDRTLLLMVDADALASCPKLTRVTFAETPYALREDEFAAFRARWPNVTTWA